MIRNERTLLARALRLLATGRVTNFEFEDLTRARTTDRAVAAIVRESWYLYSDLREYRLCGRDSLSRTARREIARWLVFLETEREYEWPDPRGVSALILLPFNVVSPCHAR